MLSISGMAGGQGTYYANLAQRDDYYTSGMEPPGQWLGKGAMRFGLTGTINAESFLIIFDGFHPATGEALVQSAGTSTHRPGWDLTFSAPKSVSVIWSQSDAPMRKAIEAAHFHAVQTAIGHIENTLLVARRGKGGALHEHAELFVATFEHSTSRAQDPQLHTHALVLNVGVREDGTLGTLESRSIFENKMLLGALYRADLAHELENNLGFMCKPHRTWFEVEGVPKPLINTFATRRAEIEAVLEERGESGARASEMAALTSREAKEHKSREELLVQWQRIGKEAGFSLDSIPRYGQERTSIQGHVPTQSHETVTSDAFELGKMDTWQTRMDTGQTRMDTGQIEVVADEIGKGLLAEITRQHSYFSEETFQRRMVEEAVGKHLSGKEALEQAERFLREKDEVFSLGRVKGKNLFTTEEMIALEKKLLQGIEDSKYKVVCPVYALDVERHLRFSLLSQEQNDALRHITQDEGQIQVVSGMAGTGKTTLLDTARKVWEDSGYTVIGTALSGQAADGLAAGAGIDSYTLASLLWEPEHLSYDGLKHHARQLWRAAQGKPTYVIGETGFDEKTVIVVDEAAMVGTRDMEALIRKTQEAGAKLVLVGDSEQLQAIEAGGSFAAIEERLGAARLVDIQRQESPWAQEAVKDFAEGRAKDGLWAFAERGHVHVAQNKPETMQKMMEDWMDAGAVYRPRDNMLFATTHKDVTTLNDMAQVARYESGLLGEIVAELGETTLYEGDMVRFTNSSASLGVRNGSLGTIQKQGMLQGILERGFTVELENGQMVQVDKETASKMNLAYALTMHNGQGMTTENAYLLVGYAMQDKEISYVQASRARGEAHFYTSRFVAGDDLSRLVKQMEISNKKQLVHDLVQEQSGEYGYATHGEYEYTTS
jgi:conjugative relaxase-like TrwC/TraI family protein